MVNYIKFAKLRPRLRPATPLGSHVTVFRDPRPVRPRDPAKPGKKPPPRRIGQEATAARHRSRSHSRAVSDEPHPTPAPTTFTFILHISPPHISLSFNFSYQLLVWPVGSDSLNISPPARWVVCPLGTRGHGRREVYIPGPRRVQV